MHKRAKQAKNKPISRKGKGIWLTSGLAQVMVLLNGVVLTITVFAILSYFINGMTKEEYQRTSKEAGDILVEGISGLENSIRIISSIFQISKEGSKAELVKQIRRTIPNLSKFDQIIFLYEPKPGNWQYETIFEASRGENKDSPYRFMPTHKLITRLVREKIFEDDSLHVYSDFSGMDYVTDEANASLKSRPFALLKVVEKGNSREGVIIGISRAVLLLDESLIDKKDAIARLTIREKDSRPLYHMDRRGSEGADSSAEQQYNFTVGSTEWKVILGFTKEQNTVLLEKLPYVVLFFGIVLTAMGILFVRNNYKYSARLARMNQTLEGKNFELENEIAERERLNQVLVKSEKENRAIIDSVSDIIFETDTGGRILFLSAAWRKITGFDPERSKDSDLFSMLHVEDQDKQRADFNLMVRGQKQAYRSFSRLRISDGTFRAVELAMSMIRQDENKNLRVVGTVTDVEERRRAERALAEAEKKYRTIVENAAGGLYQITPEGMYLSANPAMARILGYASVEEMLRVVKNANGRVYPDVREREEFVVQELIPAGQIFGTETKALRKDKAEIWVRENIRVVKDENGNVLYFEGSMEDITKRKEADIALMEAKVTSDMANRAKTEFIANMSHELRTPLNAIIGFSEIIANQVMGPIGQDIYVEYAAEVHKSGKGLLNIINEILDISKIESGKKELKESEFSIADCLESCKELLDTKIKSKRIVLIDKTADMPKIVAEESSIKQVIRNILSNAVQFTPEEGRITLFCNYDHDGSFRVCISDTGVGLTQKEIEKALSPFGQIDNALGRSTSGTGLGLPLSKALLDLHGGGLEILSEKGFGTTVAIILPAKRIIQRVGGETAVHPPSENQKV